MKVLSLLGPGHLSVRSVKRLHTHLENTTFNGVIKMRQLGICEQFRRMAFAVPAPQDCAR